LDSTPTAAAMLIGYYDRNNYPNLWAPDAGPYSDIAPLTNQNWTNTYAGTSISDFDVCPISATEMDVLGRTNRGHVDDYYSSYGSTGDPYVTNVWTEHNYH